MDAVSSKVSSDRKFLQGVGTVCDECQHVFILHGAPDHEIQLETSGADKLSRINEVAENSLNSSLKFDETI